MIPDLDPRLQEIGKIKIGRLEEKVRQSKSGAEWQAPDKLDHFIITSITKDVHNNYEPRTELMKKIAEATEQSPDCLKKIPIVFLFNDPEKNFHTFRAFYKGKSWTCRCDDGKAAKRKNEDGSISIINCDPATCPFADPDLQVHCKWNGILTCLIPQANITGGVFVMRTVGKNAISNIYASIRFIMAISFGRIAGMPLWLVVRPKTSVVKNIPTTIYIMNVEYHGSMSDLQQKALQISKETLAIEAEYSKLLPAPGVEDENEEQSKDAIREYYPEVCENDEAPGSAEQQKPQDVKAPTETAEIKTKRRRGSPITPDINIDPPANVIEIEPSAQPASAKNSSDIDDLC